jgi:hypothetical protein
MWWVLVGIAVVDVVALSVWANRRKGYRSTRWYGETPTSSWPRRRLTRR